MGKETRINEEQYVKDDVRLGLLAYLASVYLQNGLRKNSFVMESKNHSGGK